MDTLSYIYIYIIYIILATKLLLQSGFTLTALGEAAAEQEKEAFRHKCVFWQGKKAHAYECTWVLLAEKTLLH